MEPGEDPEIVAQCVCRPRDVEILLVLARLPATRGWVVTGIARSHLPLASQANGVVLFLRRKSYGPAKARELFTRLRRALEAGDLGRLLRLAGRAEVDPIFLRRAFGLSTDAEALAQRMENDTALALMGAAERGEMTREELEVCLQAAHLAFARMAGDRQGGRPN